MMLRESYGAQSGGGRGTPRATGQIDRHPSVDMFAVASGYAALARVGCKRPLRARAVRARRAARVAVRAASSEENAGESEDDDLPPPIKLTADQARIAALAFEVLYEKDPVEDLEEMLKDKERPGLRLKLQQAIKGALALPLVSSSAASSFFTCRARARRISLTSPTPRPLRAAANEVCKAGATVECAAAWEEVDGLEDAAMRAGMTQNAPSGFAQNAPSAAPSPPPAPPKPEAASTDQDPRMSNPATRAGVDPLAGMMPCAAESCEAPQGTFEARGNLERALEAGQRGRGSESEETLAEAIRDAVDVAITMCENGEDASQCAVAWEVVEELSASANKKREDDRA